MAYPSIFNEDVSNQVIARINQLKADTPALWGKMNVGQMLAHCNVTYEMVYTDKHPKPNFILKFILKTFVKGVVVGQSPYKKNSSTAPQFIMKEDKNFEAEKALLIAHIQKTQKLGSVYSSSMYK